MVLDCWGYHSMAHHNTDHWGPEPAGSSLVGWGISGICDKLKMIRITRINMNMPKVCMKALFVRLDVPLCASVSTCHVIHTLTDVVTTILPSVSLLVNGVLVKAAWKKFKHIVSFVLLQINTVVIHINFKYMYKASNIQLHLNPLRIYLAIFYLVKQLFSFKVPGPPIPCCGVGVTFVPPVAGWGFPLTIMVGTGSGGGVPFPVMVPYAGSNGLTTPGVGVAPG